MSDDEINDGKQKGQKQARILSAEETAREREIEHHAPEKRLKMIETPKKATPTVAFETVQEAPEKELGRREEAQKKVMRYLVFETAEILRKEFKMQEWPRRAMLKVAFKIVQEALGKESKMREVLKGAQKEVKKEVQEVQEEEGHRPAYVDFAKYIAAISIAVFTGVYNILDEIDCPCVSIPVQTGLFYAQVGLLFLFISFSCATILIFCQLPRNTRSRFRHSQFRCGGRRVYFQSVYVLLKSKWLRCIGSEGCARFMAFLTFWSLVAGVGFCIPHILVVIMSKT